MQGKALNYNSRQTSWHVNANPPVPCSRSTTSLSSGPSLSSLVQRTAPWSRSACGRVRRDRRLLEETDVPAQQETLPSRASHLLERRRPAKHCWWSVQHICMDRLLRQRHVLELSNSSTCGTSHVGKICRAFPEESTDVDDEAVTNEARFAGWEAQKALADLDYEAKMAAIFAECQRILADNGVLTVMFQQGCARLGCAGSALIEPVLVETSWLSQPSLSQVAIKRTRRCRVHDHACLPEATAGFGAKSFLDDLASEVGKRRKASIPIFRRRHRRRGLMLSTYGPALSVISSHWPVYSSTPDESARSAFAAGRSADIAREEWCACGRQTCRQAAQIDDYTTSPFWPGYLRARSLPTTRRGFSH